MENPRSTLGLAAHTPRYSAYGACQHGKWRITWCFRSRCDKAAGRGARTPSGGGSFSPAQWRRTDRMPEKKGRSRCASGPSLGRKRPRRAAGTRTKSRYRAAAICHRGAQNASAAGIFSTKRGRRVVALLAAWRRPAKTNAAYGVERRAQAVRRRHRGVIKPNLKPRGLFHDGGRFCRIC